MRSRNRNKRKLLWGLIFILLIGVIAEGIYIFKNNSNKLKEKTWTFPEWTANAVTRGIDIGSIIEYDKGSVAVYYPITAFDDINNVVEKWAKNELKKFRKEVQDATDEEGKENEFYITFETTRYKESLISFKFNTYKFLAGHANAEELVKTWTFDIGTSKQISIKDLFTPAPYLETLSKKAYEYFSPKDEYKDNLETLKKGLEPKTENFQNFIVNGDYLEIIFNEYQIGSRVVKTPVYKMKISEIETLKQEAIAKLNQEARDKEIAKQEELDKQREIAKEQEIAKQKELDKVVTVSDTVKIPTENIEQLKGKKLIALTFDDGPSKNNTPILLEGLKNEKVQATFFVVGQYVNYYPNLVKKMVAEGHQVGNHTYSHKQLTKLSEADVMAEINKNNEIIASVTGIKPTVFRPPYGSYNSLVQAKCNMPIIYWSMDSKDWQNPGADAITEYITSRAKDGDIILLHETHIGSVEAALKIVKKLKAEGFVFVTMDTLFKAKEVTQTNGKVYSAVR